MAFPFALWSWELIRYELEVTFGRSGVDQAWLVRVPAAVPALPADPYRGGGVEVLGVSGVACLDRDRGCNDLLR